MTFQSLYRLERRGELGCSIVGVAIDEWSDEDLRKHATDSIREQVQHVDEESLERLPRPPLLHPGRLRQGRDLRAGRQGDRRRRAAGLLSRDPAVAVRRGRAPAGRRGLTEGARVVIEKPFGHDLESARKLNAELHEVLDEEQIFRIDHFLGKEPVMDILFLRFANVMLEPIWNRALRRLRADHARRGLRGRGPRQLLRRGRRAARRRPEPPPPGARPRRDGAAVGRRRPRPRRRPQARPLRGDSDRRPDALRPRPVRGLPQGRRRGAGLPPRPSSRSSSTPTTGAGTASRSSSAPARSCPST